MTTRSRIAPTPSGYLHIGNAFNFIFTWLLVKKENGSLRLRIDDLDATRARPEFIEDIFNSLRWLGIEWDEGPQSPAEHYDKFSQQSRMELYRVTAGQLKIRAACFYCSCSRASKQPCKCFEKTLVWKPGETALKISTASDSSISFFDSCTAKQTQVYLDTEMKDFVIWRKDDFPAYQLASLVDDLEHGTNLIVRGQDLLSSTGAQLFLGQKLGRNEFAQGRFYHHPLRVDGQGKKLSKSAGSDSLKSMRQRGVPATEIYRQFAAWRGWEVQPESLSEMLLMG